MNLHEYQAKELLKKFGLPIPNGNYYIENLDNIGKDLDSLNGPPWVVKSQIHAGGRGAGCFLKSINEKGGVQIAQSKEQVVNIANAMLNNTLITKQTGEKGKKVNRIYIEESCLIEKEYYLSLLIDRNSSNLMLMLSESGGIDIEKIVLEDPDKIKKIFFSSLKSFEINNNVKEMLNFDKNQFDQFKDIVSKLCKAFVELDASTIEINPLVLNNAGQLILLDAKINLDDNALFRHPELLNLQDLSEENEMELEAAKNNMSYIKLDGEIGCMVNGAGLAMATMDIIKQFGKEPANFLDLGGTANKERAIKGFKIIQSDPKVKAVFINIFGGIIHCDMIAKGIIEAIKETNFDLPVVVRFQGTNALEGRNIINDSNIDLIAIDDFTEAAKKVVALAI
tara:strand:+ start:11663 stop:12847 length:1185 start_codon:yes stop_codon:yes gene_type:complete